MRLARAEGSGLKSRQPRTQLGREAYKAFCRQVLSRDKLALPELRRVATLTGSSLSVCGANLGLTGSENLITLFANCHTAVSSRFSSTVPYKQGSAAVNPHVRGSGIRDRPRCPKGSARIVPWYSCRQRKVVLDQALETTGPLLGTVRTIAI